MSLAQPNLTWGVLEPTAEAPLVGGMGVVFSATWRRSLPEKVAVKVLKAGELSAAACEAASSPLEQEAAALQAACADRTNPYVALLYGLVRGPPTPAWATRLGPHSAALLSHSAEAQLLGLVMRWEPGGSLSARLHSGAVPWAAKTSERLCLLERVAAGVASLHAASPTIVHGDIKPDNVLLAADGAPRLSDFGLAQLRSAVATSAGRSTVATTAKVAGT